MSRLSELLEQADKRRYRVVIIALDEDGIEDHDIRRGEYILHADQFMVITPATVAVSVTINAKEQQ